MASFDFVNSAAKGYEFVWSERKYLSRVAAPVFFVKLVCLFAVFVFGAQDKYMLQGIISMPGLVIEAIFVIGLIRYILYREPIFIWGKLIIPPQSEEEPAPYQGGLSKKQCVQGGIAIYLLIRVIETCLLGISMDMPMPSSAEISEEEIIKLSPALSSFIMFSFLILLIWVFKFFWLFVPVSAGFSMSYFIKKMPKLRGNIGMIAVWIICSLPLMVMFSAVLQAISESFEGGSVSDIVSTSIIKSMAEIIIISVQVTAMTYGIHKILLSKED